MKTNIRNMALCLLLIGSVAMATDVRVGDSYDQVMRLMGPANGVLETEAQTWLRYDRGMIKLQSNRVVEVDMVSPAEAQRRAAHDQSEWARLRQWERDRIRQDQVRAEAARRAKEQEALLQQRLQIALLEARVQSMEQMAAQQRRSVQPVYVMREAVYPVSYAPYVSSVCSTPSLRRGGWPVSYPVYSTRSYSASNLDRVYGGMSVMSTPGYTRSGVRGSVRVSF